MFHWPLLQSCGGHQVKARLTKHGKHVRSLEEKSAQIVSPFAGLTFGYYGVRPLWAATSPILPGSGGHSLFLSLVAL